MIRNNRAPFPMIIIRVFDMVNPEIVKTRYTKNVEEKNTTSFSNEGDFYGVETETNSFSSTENTAEDADVVSELLG
jgi:hypothetical protein